MENLYMLSDNDIMGRIGRKIKELRLKQDISQQSLADSSNLSLSTVIRAEDGSIKSVDALVRILRTLGKLDIFLPLTQEEPISPNEYYKFVNSMHSNRRERASRQNKEIISEGSEW